MPRPVRFALCQLASEPPTIEGNVAANAAKVEKYAAQAAREGADVFVLVRPHLSPWIILEIIDSKRRQAGILLDRRHVK